MGKLCACPDRLKEQLSHSWPTTMDDICKAVTQPLEEDINVAHRFCDIEDDEINWLQLANVDLCEDLTAENRAQL